jgi:hypothetical protein
MPLDSQNDNPPEVRVNSDGRITNIDDIRGHLSEYSLEELDGIKVKISLAITKAK